MADYEELAGKLKREVERRCGGQPLARHIYSVAEFARRIAGYYDVADGVLGQKAYAAGLAHDLYKKYTEDELRGHIREQGVPVDEAAWEFGGGLLHAPPAAHYLRVDCGVEDEDLICAVYYHTTGRAAASLLEKVLFCADYLDPSREVRSADPAVEAMTKRVTTDLESVYREVIARKLESNISRGKPLHPNGIAAWNEALTAV